MSKSLPVIKGRFVTTPARTHGGRVYSKKQWCAHIKWDRNNNGPQRHWQFNDGFNDIIRVPRNWKACPICEGVRPTKANIAAATLRFLLDNDQ